MTDTAAAEPDADIVELSVPADPAYVSVLRTVTASLAARRDFTIDEIDDLRIAVDEASALLLPHTTAGQVLRASFRGTEDSLVVDVSIAAADGTAKPDQTSFSWMVLAALADAVDTSADGGRLTLTLTKTRAARSA
ncbi:MAG TPA: ATP-binding protein [Jatrophihabitans sp.]|nr:ATP-binding protein [Jatrophihabitans sp.]